jgi:hypothetical protein
MNKEIINNLVKWTYNPDPPEQIYNILASMQDADLIVAMTSLDEAAGRVAWAEYGRRKGFFDFEIRVVQVEDSVKLSFEADTKPIHHTPIIKLRD